MSDSLLATLLLSLDGVVFERTPEGAFTELTPLPDWFPKAYHAIGPGRAIKLAEALPFLEVFLGDAEVFWYERRPGVVRSEPFTVQHADVQVLLRAVAVWVDSRPLLLIERLAGAADPRDVLQAAREKSIEHERLLQNIDRLRAPVASLQRAASALAAADLAAQQRVLADEIASLAARIQAAVGPPTTRR